MLRPGKQRLKYGAFLTMKIITGAVRGGDMPLWFQSILAHLECIILLAEMSTAF